MMTGGAPAAGWTLYAPLTLQMGPSMDAGIFALHILGASSIMGSINIIVTILNMRAPGMTLMKMPLFCWTWLITAYLLVAAMPVLAGAVTMSLVDFLRLLAIQGRIGDIGTDQGVSATARADESFTVESLVSDAAGRPTGVLQEAAMASGESLSSRSPAALAELINAVPVQLNGTAPIARAISPSTQTSASSS